MCTFALIQAVTNIYFSEQYKASWVYYARPVGTPGNVMAGAFKAVYIKYYFPFAAVISVFVIALGGWTYIFDVLLAQMNILIFVLITMRMGSAALPFSLKEQMKQRGGKAVIRMVVTLLAIPIIGGAHYLAVKFWMLKIIVLPLTGILCWMLWDSYIKTTWNAILQPDADE
ncbi:MAG: hypothetical protein EOP49_12480 [Sphingobacteriales bacterium]|nr:MAG: hypothetical protein EOP49_12480 [Sphingobacteriales bacterium]